MFYLFYFNPLEGGGGGLNRNRRTLDTRVLLFGSSVVNFFFLLLPSIFCHHGSDNWNVRRISNRLYFETKKCE